MAMKMKTQSDRKLAEEIVKILPAFDEDVLSGPITQPFAAFSSGDWFIELMGTSAEAYFRGLNIISEQPGILNLYSKSTLKNSFNRLIVDIYEKYGVTAQIKPIRQEILAWWDRLVNKPEETYSCIFVVQGIKISDDTKIGRVLIERLDDVRYECLIQTLFDFIDASTYYSRAPNTSKSYSWQNGTPPTSSQILPRISASVL